MAQFSAVRFSTWGEWEGREGGRSRKEQAPLPTTLSHGAQQARGVREGRPRVGTSEVELEQSSLMVINVRRSQCNSRRKKRARSSRKRLARFSLRCFDASYTCMCLCVYICVCMGRVSGLTRNGGNPLVDWFVTSVLYSAAQETRILL